MGGGLALGRYAVTDWGPSAWTGKRSAPPTSRPVRRTLPRRKASGAFYGASCYHLRRGSLPPRPSPCGKLGPRRHGLSSNAERGTPDWRMIAISVPVRSSR